ncbi:hypothetical protein R3P38DRAFT_2552449 [Favolaschia claudopus]|uniref:Uncharacterized protein n=1 Tax=Favolaschia claudopus TaxID=2862362 RepID=A0AAW0AF06_9AGAR
MAAITSATTAPPILHFGLNDTDLKIDSILHIVVNDVPVRYILRGVIYSGGNHFTCRVLTENGNIWYHDGIETGKDLIDEGDLHSKPAKFLNTCIRNDYCRLGVGAIYAIVE